MLISKGDCVIDLMVFFWRRGETYLNHRASAYGAMGHQIDLFGGGGGGGGVLNSVLNPCPHYIKTAYNTGSL